MGTGGDESIRWRGPRPGRIDRQDRPAPASQGVGSPTRWPRSMVSREAWDDDRAGLEEEWRKWAELAF